MSNLLSFECEHNIHGEPIITPCIDNVSLAVLVTAYESGNGYDDPTGGYAGIIPSHYDLGPVSRYFLGLEEPVGGGEQGEIYTLFCNCGEAGCWPLAAYVRENKHNIIWERFAQPYRPNRDYSGFGPFEFNREDYCQAIAKAELFCG